jgi:HTH-type transcriptional regulator/antitoxin HigA
MEQLGYKQKDLAAAIGLKSRVSEILNRKRKLTLDMIRKLHVALGIPTEVLVKEY